MTMKISEVLTELQRTYDEFGDVEVEMFDAMDMDMYQPVSHVKFDQDRARAQILSDR
jgi:hypothetical protein